MSSAVSRPPAAPSDEALVYFRSLLTFETDCWDVNHAVSNGRQDFVLLDVRAESLYTAGHLPAAVNLPHHRINHDSMSAYPADTLFVVYCAGPHCNGADKGAIRLAELGRPVKKMIGGAVSYTHLTLPTT